MNSDNIKKLRVPEEKHSKKTWGISDQRTEFIDAEMEKDDQQEFKHEPCTFVVIMEQVIREMF